MARKSSKCQLSGRVIILIHYNPSQVIPVKVLTDNYKSVSLNTDQVVIVKAEMKFRWKDKESCNSLNCLPVLYSLASIIGN